MPAWPQWNEQAQHGRTWRTGIEARTEYAKDAASEVADTCSQLISTAVVRRKPTTKSDGRLATSD